ncbi:hypothetical protein NMH_0226 [Neisseria meningitidis H44/76]|uniref:Uncharacterized protein n=1 Tax=Neisseria meningitidis serogroup B / serotype 15 (strain H44/76) TaxID=909420 RepID=E6MTY5_NEIMH|nr:hypothetical protein NMH_0226 [Neisseria meningitidis H44/76]
MNKWIHYRLSTAAGMCRNGWMMCQNAQMQKIVVSDDPLQVV